MGQYLRIEPSELFHALFEIFEDEAKIVDQEFAWIHQANPLAPPGLELNVPWLFRKRDLIAYSEYFRFKPQDCEKYLGGEFFRWKRIDKFKDWIMILVRPERLEQETGFRGLFTKEGEKLDYIANVLKGLPPDLEFKAMMCLGLSKPESLRKVLHPQPKPKIDTPSDIPNSPPQGDSVEPNVQSSMIEEPLPREPQATNEPKALITDQSEDLPQPSSTHAFFRLAQQCLHARLLKSKLKKLFYLALKAENITPVSVSRNVSGIVADYSSKQLSELPTQATTTEYSSATIFNQPPPELNLQNGKGGSTIETNPFGRDQKTSNEAESESSAYARLLLHLYFTSKSLRTYVVQCMESDRVKDFKTRLCASVELLYRKIR